MIYKDFQGLKLSALGFGAMRLPLDKDGKVDRAATVDMVDYALEKGINYFDTAWPYHGGTSELILGEALSRHPRESYFLATKYPGHQDLPEYRPELIFEQQLTKCRTEYFDFYLLHNVIERSVNTYTDPKWGIVDYFLEQKRLGRIKHLGFSTHARPETLRRFLEYCGDKIDFCQIQLNYLDWSLQKAEEKCRILKEFNIPIWVMEPLRGGRLANLKDDEQRILNENCPGLSPVELAFRWVRSIPEVTVILSGMSDMKQLQENIHMFEADRPLEPKELLALELVAQQMKNAVPCTACRYCCDGCPMGLNIPLLISMYNEARFNPKGAMPVSMQLDALGEESGPAACIGCGACAAACPQSIDIPAVMQAFAELKPMLPNWGQICRERAEAERKLREGK